LQQAKPANYTYSFRERKSLNGKSPYAAHASEDEDSVDLTYSADEEEYDDVSDDDEEGMLIPEVQDLNVSKVNSALFFNFLRVQSKHILGYSFEERQ